MNGFDSSPDVPPPLPLVLLPVPPLPLPTLLVFPLLPPMKSWSLSLCLSWSNGPPRVVGKAGRPLHSKGGEGGDDK